MCEKNNLRWHVDKRVSVGHLITTLTIIFGVVAWSFQIQGKIERNEARISANAGHISDLRTQSAQQYHEIIRRLEQINQNDIEHLAAHANGND